MDAVKQIAKFLNKNLSKSLIARIAEKCSFKNLKKANDIVKERPNVPMVTDVKFETGHMYRKGESSPTTAITLSIGTTHLLTILLKFENGLFHYPLMCLK